MTFYTFVLTSLSIFGIGGLIRVMIGPTIWDRMLGYNLISSKIIMIIIILALQLDKPYILDTAILYALLGFVGIVMIARFIERRGDL